MAAPKKKTTLDKSELAKQTLDLARAVSLNSRMKDESYNPPKFKNFMNSNFAGKDMSEMFEAKVINHGNFTGSDLSGANFRGFNLQGCIFKDCNLQDTDFAGADLRWSDFRDSDYYGKARFSDVDEDGAPIFDSDGRPVNLANTRETEGITR
jgi:uncharacterized protein YjbI with pentapeptide repeats